VSRLAFLFPGQGSQHPGMGSELAREIPTCREVFETGDRALDWPLSRLCFEGGEEELALTENTQPAILAVSVAVLKALTERGIRPAAAAGHSLGEYSAHVAAGTVGFEDALRAVRRRGRFMQEAVPVGAGAMAAVIGLKADRVEAICREVAGDEVVAAANLNGPVQTVIAGHTAAVDRAVELAQESGARRAVRLAVSAPFHCSLMRSAGEKLRPVLEALDFNDPEIPVYSNADARTVDRGAAARDALVRQVTLPVRWQELIEAMLQDGVDTFVEVGPGKVLSGLVRRIDRGVRVLRVAEPAEVESVAAELGVAA
jgi:[acyl-carrier-protein] S-malonyltransferase